MAGLAERLRKRLKDETNTGLAARLRDKSRRGVEAEEASMKGKKKKKKKVSKRPVM